MNFEIYRPVTGGGIRLQRGEVTVAANGRLTVPRVDLEAVGANRDVTLMYDKTARLIGIRRPRPGDPTVKVRGKDNAATATISIRGPLARLSVAAASIKGRRKSIVSDQQQLITIPVGDDVVPAKGARRA